MAGFTKLSFNGTVTFIGFVKKRADDLKSESLASMEVDWDGVKGDDHAGRTRPSCARVSMLYPKGTEIANARQLSIMSRQELTEIAQIAEISENQPQWWGANLVIEGIPELSALPPSTRLRWQSGATLRVDMENGPCIYAAKEVDHFFKGKAKDVLTAARHRRGVVASVERSGKIDLGSQVEVFIPQARPYKYLS